MKRFVITCTTAIALLAAVAVAGDQHAAGGWFDMTNCDFCKPMMAEKGLMEKMSWEHQTIATGMVVVTKVDPAFEAAYGRAMKGMMEIVGKSMNGEKVNACGHCNSMTELGKAGAKMENFDKGGVHVMTATSTDPKVIAKIHAHVKMTTDEMAKMATHDDAGHTK